MTKVQKQLGNMVSGCLIQRD